MQRIVDYSIPIVLAPTKATKKSEEQKYNPKYHVYILADENWAKVRGSQLKLLAKVPKGNKVKIMEVIPKLIPTKIKTPTVVTKRIGRTNRSTTQTG